MPGGERRFVQGHYSRRGGGYGVVTAAKLLDGNFDVVIVEKEAFFHNVGTFRGVVERGFLGKLQYHTRLDQYMI